MKLVNITRNKLVNYTVKQLNNFYPYGCENIQLCIDRNINEALARLNKSIDAVHMWKSNEFYYLHSSQYCMYLYFLANTIWKNTNDAEVCSKLFFLNKTLNGIDLFYEIEMPNIFFVGHSVGIVLAKATYGDYFAIYQNSTVGKNKGIAPIIKEGVLMYPNSAIIGSSVIENHVTISQGTSIVNKNIPKGKIVFSGAGREIVLKTSSSNLIEDIFRVS